MSAANMSAALRVRGLTLVTRAIFAYLCDRERNNVCWPSIDEMAWELDISRRAAIAAIKKLESLEYIAVARKPRQSSVYRILCIPVANRYREVRAAMRGAQDAPINGAHYAPTYGAPDAPIDSAQDAPLPEEQVHEVHTDGAQDALHQVHEVHPESPKEESPKDSPKKAKRAHARARLEKGGPEFAEFYEAYPRKVAPDDAARAYAAAIGRGATHEGIMEALRRQRLGGFSAWNPTPKFRPHPASWLNGGQWKDQAPERDPEYDISKLTGYPAELARVSRERAELAERERQSQPWLLEHAS